MPGTAAKMAASKKSVTSAEERRIEMRKNAVSHRSKGKFSYAEGPAGPPPADLTEMTDHGVVDHLASLAIFFSKELRYKDTMTHWSAEVSRHRVQSALSSRSALQEIMHEVITRANPDDLAIACIEIMKAMVMMSVPSDLSGPFVRDPLRIKKNWSAALRAATHLPDSSHAELFPAPPGFIPKLTLFLMEHLEGLGVPEEIPWPIAEEVLLLLAEVWRFLRPDLLDEANIDQTIKAVDKLLQAMAQRQSLLLASIHAQEMYQRMLTGMRMVISRLLEMAPALLGDDIYATVRSRLLRQHEHFEVATGHFARLNTSRTWSLPPPSAPLSATSQRIFMGLSIRRCLYPLNTALAKLPQDVPVVPFPVYVARPMSQGGNGAVRMARVHGASERLNTAPAAHERDLAAHSCDPAVQLLTPETAAASTEALPKAAQRSSKVLPQLRLGPQLPQLRPASQSHGSDAIDREKKANLRLQQIFTWARRRQAILERLGPCD